MRRSTFSLLVILLFAASGILTFRYFSYHNNYPEVDNSLDKGLSSKPKKGPELERWFFSKWHEPFGNVLPSEVLINMQKEVSKVAEETGSTESGWVSVGPFGMRVPSTTTVHTGRILDIAIKNNGETLIAAASGGLWRTNSTKGIPLSDGIINLAVSSIAVSPAQQNTIFIGTGEPWVRSGSGVFKSTNNGDLWSKVETFPAVDGVYKIRYQPGTTLDNIYAATTNGYIRSTNGGASWSKTLEGLVTDFVVVSPENVQACAKYGDSKLYVSTNHGSSWIAKQMQVNGVNLTNTGRVALAYMPETATLFASIAKQDDHKMLGVYKSTNLGDTWSNISPLQDFMMGQGWYDNVIAVKAPSTVYVGGVTLMRSLNGGTSWELIDNINIHADIHAILFRPNTNEIYIGTDGGLTLSTNSGTSWNTSLNNFPITQYVNIDVAGEDLNYIGGGSQDNGLSITTNLGSSWSHSLGGDGGGVAFDPENKNKIYATLGVYGGDWAFRRLKTSNAGQNWTHINLGVAPSNQWYHRIRHDRVSPVWLYNNSGPFIYKSTNFGDQWEKLNTTPFNGNVEELTVSNYVDGSVVYACMENSSNVRLWVYDDNQFFSNRIPADLPADVTIRKVSPHPTSKNIAFLIMNGISQQGPTKKIYRTLNRGISWENITANLPNIPFSDVVVHPTLSTTIVASSEMGSYKSVNGGLTWTKWNTGMPDGTIITELKYVDKLSSEGKFIIVAGTYGRGIYVRELNDLPVVTVNNEISPEGYNLAQNFPNPFNPSTIIKFTIPQKEFVTIKVFNLQGKEVASLVNNELDKGEHEIVFDGKGLASAVYIYKMQAGNYSVGKKMTFIK
jgi:hypothetical protein